MSERSERTIGTGEARPVQEHRYDVVIVGAGGAGMRAAIEAGPRVRTAVLTKLYPTRSHTGAAQGGMCAALANVEEDNWEWHTFDTVKGGDYLVDQDAAEIMAKEAIDAVLDLEKMGLPFNRTPEGKIDQRRFGGHTRDHGKAPVRRACYAADRTGHMILQTLYQNCVKHDVEFFNEFYVLDLVLTETDRGPVATGVVAYELATGEIHVFHAKSIVFATGGSGRMYKTTSNAHTLTGDGMAIVFRKGLPLEDMEFHQFHPTGLAGLGILISEAVRGEGGILRNADGERFMERYAPTIKDLAPRDGAGGVGGPRRGTEQGLRLHRRHPPRRGRARGEAARHHRVLPYLPGCGPGEGTGAGVPDLSLRDGWHPDPHPRRGAAQQQRHRPRPLRRGRVRVCLGARRQPSGHQLAAGHQRVRPPRGHRGRGVRAAQ
jgi:succinate dehydrogenase / fumarate reductase flavoprotein subunit